MEITKSFVTDPEYQLFFNDPSLPPGLSFDTQNGTLSGTPTQPGKWTVYPAVRDKIRGDNVYHGHGYWWTTYKQWEGSTWTKSTIGVVINVTT